MAVIQTYNKISSAGLSRFDDRYTVTDNAENPDAILVRSASLHEVAFGDNVKAIARAGAGVNNIPLDRCSEAGICVFNTPGANANAVKELVLTGIFLSSRKIPEALCWASKLEDGELPVAKQVEKGKSQFAGPEIQGKTLGVIGLGAIGAMVANAASALGMNVVGTDPFLSVNAALRLCPSVRLVDKPEDIYAVADYITIHVPFNADTKHMIDAEALNQMKDGVRVLNYARGELVCDADMLAAIESGKVSYYCTDFPNADLVGKKGVIATPHLGASTPESEENCAAMAADELIAYLERGDIRNSVNFPNLSLDAKNTKICIMHKNDPDVLPAIIKALEEQGSQIENQAGATRNAYAYTILDVKNSADPAAIAGIDGVIRVRTF